MGESRSLSTILQSSLIPEFTIEVLDSPRVWYYREYMAGGVSSKSNVIRHDGNRTVGKYIRMETECKAHTLLKVI